MSSPETRAEPTRAKRRWTEPAIRNLGRLGPLVQGGGKAGSNVDSDPNNTVKTGTG